LPEFHTIYVTKWSEIYAISCKIIFRLDLRIKNVNLGKLDTTIYFVVTIVDNEKCCVIKEMDQAIRKPLQ